MEFVVIVAASIDNIGMDYNQTLLLLFVVVVAVVAAVENNMLVVAIVATVAIAAIVVVVVVVSVPELVFVSVFVFAVVPVVEVCKCYLGCCCCCCSTLCLSFFSQLWFIIFDKFFRGYVIFSGIRTEKKLFFQSKRKKKLFFLQLRTTGRTVKQTKNNSRKLITTRIYTYQLFNYTHAHVHTHREKTFFIHK